MTTNYGRSFISLTRRALLAFSVVFSLSACQDYTPANKDAPANTSVMFVKGDPNELIRGATLQPVSPFTEQNISDLESYSLMGLSQFPEKEKAKPIDTNIDQDKILKENEAKNISEPEKTLTDIYKIKVQKDSEGAIGVFLFGGVVEIKMSVGAGEKLVPVAFVTEKQRLPIEALHWSVTPDKKFISLLVRASEEDAGRELIVLTFEKTTQPEPAQLTDKKYIYLGGPGNKFPWKNLPENTLTVSLCGNGTNQNLVERAVKSWGQVLMGRINLKFEKKSTYAPFSDLNEHCVQMVNAYIYDSRDNVAVYGMTLYRVSLSKKQLVDSDVFMFSEEFNKESKAMVRAGYSVQEASDEVAQKFYPALFHELGHLLGLDHKFDGTRSVMSYQIKDSEPQAYDIEALQNLYPLVPAKK